MNLLFTVVVLSLAPVAPAHSPAVVEPDSGSVEFTTEAAPSLPLEDALMILMSEHRLSIPIQLLEVAEYQPAEL